MRRGAVLLLLPLLFSCGGEEAAQSPPTTACPSDDAGSATVAIDWVPFVVLDGIQYVGGYAPEDELAADEVGEQVGVVACTIAEHVFDPGFDLRDGDAAFLPAGTTVHAVAGRPVEEAVAAQEDGVWRIYAADEG